MLSLHLLFAGNDMKYPWKSSETIPFSQRLTKSLLFWGRHGKPWSITHIHLWIICWPSLYTTFRACCCTLRVNLHEIFNIECIIHNQSLWVFFSTRIQRTFNQFTFIPVVVVWRLRWRLFTKDLKSRTWSYLIGTVRYGFVFLDIHITVLHCEGT